MNIFCQLAIYQISSLGPNAVCLQAFIPRAHVDADRAPYDVPDRERTRQGHGQLRESVLVKVTTCPTKHSSLSLRFRSPNPFSIHAPVNHTVELNCQFC